MDTYLTVWHVAYVVILVPTVVGNGLIILSIIRYHYLRTKMHILIGNLAVSDLVVGLILIPCDFIGDMVGLNYNKIYCLSKLSIFIVSLGGSCFSLFLISIERLIVIVYPLSRRHFLTKCRIVILIILGWIYVFSAGALPLLGWNRYTENQTDCESDSIYTIGYQYFINIQFTAVLVCNTVLYAVVMRIAMKSARSTQLREGRIITARSEKDIQKLKMMVTILGVFIVCWGPYVVIISILFFHDSPDIRLARRSALIPGVINSALNWLVYGYFNKDFRTAFKEILKCQQNTTVEFGKSVHFVPSHRVHHQPTDELTITSHM